MSTIRLRDEALNFTARSSEGEINFHNWLEDSNNDSKKLFHK
jgi:hypothetical protein